MHIMYDTYEKASTATCKPGIPPTLCIILTIVVVPFRHHKLMMIER